jgi:hypothetical protein
MNSGNKVIYITTLNKILTLYEHETEWNVLRQPPMTLMSVAVGYKARVVFGHVEHWDH